MRRPRVRHQGKTSLVRKYVDAKSKLYSVVVWFSADQLVESCVAIAAKLKIDCQPSEALDAVADWIGKADGTKLLVLDNADAVSAHA